MQRFVDFRKNLIGEGAFYQSPSYLETTRLDFAQKKPLQPIYTWNTESKIIRLVKLIFSILIFPIGLYKCLRALAGFIVVPASISRLMGYPKNFANDVRLQIPLEGGWKFKRISIEFDGYKIDALIIGKKSTFGNGRWMVPALGNGEFYETLPGGGLNELMNRINSNAIVFNYPGVGASSGGPPNREAMTKAYRAVLTFLEDREKGIGAKEIIGYGFSIGGGIQAEALKSHSLKKDIRYVFIKDRTFSDLSTTAAALVARPLGALVKILGWNISSVDSSKELKVPEIILQTAHVKGYTELKDTSKIADDGIIPSSASLAKALLKEGQPKDKIFIGIPEGHNKSLTNVPFLAEKIESLLQRPCQSFCCPATHSL